MTWRMKSKMGDEVKFLTNQMLVLETIMIEMKHNMVPESLSFQKTQMNYVKIYVKLQNIPVEIISIIIKNETVAILNKFLNYKCSNSVEHRNFSINFNLLQIIMFNLNKKIDIHEPIINCGCI